jgi:hypothetical protein
VRSEQTRLDWHTAFYEAFRAELAEYGDGLDFHKEVQLVTEPLRMDVLVVNKLRGRKIEKNIARAFRGHNIVEYKSPGESISVGDFHKACSYLHLFVSLNNISVTDVTLTLVVMRRPAALLKHFGQLGVGITEQSPGIYLAGTGMFPTQIIESKKLPEEENVWLGNLRRNLGADRLRRVVELKSEGYPRSELAAYFYTLLAANPESVKDMEADIMGRTTLAQVLEEIGITQQWEARGISKGVQGSLYVIKGLKNNIPLAKLSEDSNIPVEEIEKIRAELS